MTGSPLVTDNEDERSMQDLHRAYLEQESRIPEEGNEKGPWWIYATIVLVLSFSFFYMGRYLGEISDRPHVLFTSDTPAEVTVQEVDRAVTGQRIYVRLCQSCHQQDGRGITGVFPPLAGSDWVNGPSEKPVSIVIHGMHGPIIRDGIRYDAAMPGFGRLLSDEDVAAVVSYIRGAFGNDTPEILPGEVKQVRERAGDRGEPWTETELRELILM